MRFIDSLLFTRLFYRFNGAMIVVYVFRYFEWEPIFYVMTIYGVVKSVTRFFVRPGAPVIVGINDDCANLRYFFKIRVYCSFRVDVGSGKRNVVASRRVYFASVRVPCQ